MGYKLPFDSDYDVNDALAAIKKSGEAVLKIYKKIDVGEQVKGDKSPVTEADIASNKVLMEGLAKTGIKILSEEEKDFDGRVSENQVWIIDPLDGTMDFIQKTGEFSVMVGLVEGRKCVFGVVYQPSEERWYVAEKGKGASLNVTSLKRSTKIPLSIRESSVSLTICGELPTHPCLLLQK